MNAVIGLVEREDVLHRTLSGLQAAGFSYEVIDTSDNSSTLWEQVTATSQHSVRRAAGIGAGLTGAAYAAIGFSAARCAINGGYSASWSVGTVLVFVLIGLGLGAFIGAFMGRVDAKEDVMDQTIRALAGKRTGIFGKGGSVVGQTDMLT